MKKIIAISITCLILSSPYGQINSSNMDRYGISMTQFNSNMQNGFYTPPDWPKYNLFTDTVKPKLLTDSTALLSINDVNDILKYLSVQEMKPVLFEMIKQVFDQMVQARIKEFNKPKKP